MSVDIICPLYNAEKYIKKLDESLKKQKEVRIDNIIYILTESQDTTEEILKKNKITYKKIKKEEFSHSLVRETAAMNSKADIVCFITQDIVIEDELWLSKLIKNIESGKSAAAFSRQISKYNNIEKYTREKNYPKESRIVSKKDIESMGLRTFFFSDASSAIKTEVFKALNGYDHKKLPINEDMYIAYKLITNGYKISYEASSVVYHSHHFTLKELYNRYKLTGQFMKENSYLDQYGTTKTGGGLAKYILIRAIKDCNIKVLLRFPFDMGARWFGMKAGKK
ncbi:MAG: glycosyltransferase family 2 protein [Bacilli bacterium]|nr:glycosyltransferase family 2 protein [Bacilli bacterium]